MVASFDCAKNVHSRDIRAGEGAVVYDLLNTRSCRCNLRCQIGQSTGSIADDSGESTKSAIRDQAAFNYTTENVGINVPTSKQQNHSSAGEFF